jgi:hypothetical protein
MSATEFWGVVMAMLAIVVPLWLAWTLLGWSERRKVRRSARLHDRRP